MEIVYKGKKTVFDVNVCSKLTFDEFKQICLSLSPFKLMQSKERTDKIKEVYGDITRIPKEPGKVEYSKDIRKGSEGEYGRNTGVQQTTTGTGSKHQKSEDKTKIQEPIVRKEKGKKES